MQDVDQVRSNGRRTIAVVVPLFEEIGGVTTVAEFICRTIRQRPDFNLKVVSLAKSSRDNSSLLLRDVGTWKRGATVRIGRARNEEFTHVGARLGEFEFQRMAPRPQLSRLLADCDLIQVVAGTPAWARPVIGLGKPVVLQVATLTKVERRMQARVGRGFLGLWRAAMTQVTSFHDYAALSQVDAIMVENPWMEKLARSLTRKRQIIEYAPPGVDTAFFHPLGPNEDHASIARVDPRIGYILAVGRFSDPRKNANLLLRSFIGARKRSARKIKLVIAGDDPGASFWNEAAACGLADDIVLESSPSDERLGLLYRHAVCLCLPSDEEGFGMVVVEAMASGIPVVATRCGGPEGIITEGKDGFLVECDDDLRMAERLAFVADNTEARAAMARSARATVESRFSLEVSGARFLAAYDKLLVKAAETQNAKRLKPPK